MLLIHSMNIFVDLHMSSAVVATIDTVVNKRGQENPCPHGAYIPGMEKDEKHLRK